MSRRPFAFLLGTLFILALFLGCTSQPETKPSGRLVNGVDLDAVAKCLPPGLNLNTKVDPYHTLQEKLVEVRASCKDGKLYAPDGKAIYFYWVRYRNDSSPLSIEQSDEKAKIVNRDRIEIEKLQKDYCVIVMKDSEIGL